MEAPPDPDALFFERQGPRAARILDALGAVYGPQAAAQWLPHYDQIARRTMRARPASLHALDRSRLDAPDWFQRPDMVGYSCYLDRFAGTLAGLEDRLDYLADLKVRYLHLLPILRPRDGKSDGGFAVKDYRALDPALGHMPELPGLTAALRQRGISLCLDLALNHTADDHAWAQAARNGEARYRHYYHFLPDSRAKDAFEAHLPQIFPATAPGNFTYQPRVNAWVWTSFYPYQWDLNWANPQVFAEMLEIILFLANQGVEVLRLDSLPFLWKRLGTDCQNQPEVHHLVRALRAYADIAAPALVFKAETIVPPEALARYLGGPDDPQCQISYHSVLMPALWTAYAEGQAWPVRDLLARMPARPTGTAWLSYLRCHDDIGWKVLAGLVAARGIDPDAFLRRIQAFFAGADSDARGRNFQTEGSALHGTNGSLAALAGLQAAEQAGDPAAADRAVARILMLYGLIFALDGLPLIYMGDEIGQPNDERYADTAPEPEDGRWLHRGAMDWARAARRSDPASVEGRLFAGLRHLAAVRADTPCLHADRPLVPLDLDPPGLLGFRRGSDRDGLTVIANLTGSSASLAWPGCWRDRLRDAAHQDRLDLPAWSCLWLERRHG